MFRGCNVINLDSKGRMAIPTCYRNGLLEKCQGKVVLTTHYSDPCLLLYPLPDWDVLQARIQSLSNSNNNMKKLERKLVGHASDLEMDAQGRILIPPLLRERAGLDKKVALVGQSEKFELWSEERWDAVSLEEPEELPDFRI